MEAATETLLIGWEIARRMLVKAGPYLFIEAVLPGGTLIALLFYWYRRHLKTNSCDPVELTQARTTMEQAR